MLVSVTEAVDDWLDVQQVSYQERQRRGIGVIRIANAVCLRQSLRCHSERTLRLHSSRTIRCHVKMMLASAPELQTNPLWFGYPACRDMPTGQRVKPSLQARDIQADIRQERYRDECSPATESVAIPLFADVQYTGIERGGFKTTPQTQRTQHRGPVLLHEGRRPFLAHL